MENNLNLVRIFGYETGEKRNSVLWASPDFLNVNSAKMMSVYLGWQHQKRAITYEEIIQGTWIKVSDHGYNFKVKFFADGTLTESDLFNENVSWKGSWKLIGMALRMNVEKYELDIFANKEGVIHSGIEMDTSTRLPNAYFKVIHII